VTDTIIKIYNNLKNVSKKRKHTTCVIFLILFNFQVLSGHLQGKIWDKIIKKLIKTIDLIYQI